MVSSQKSGNKCESGTGRCSILRAPGYEQIDEQWFSPTFWADKAQPVEKGGRGGAWFIDREPSSLVLRHYRRGGAVAKLIEKTYLFTGFDRTRSHAEFKLLNHLFALGLPVPEPVSALACLHGLLWYQAAIMLKRIPGAVTFFSSTHLCEPSLWEELGYVIRRFHDHGLNHVDLNCDNVLIASEKIYIIDFDRCRVVPQSRNVLDANWKRRNIERLHRSIRKRCPERCLSKQPKLWQHFLKAYHHHQ
ncbi:3-deoxy-D-manno-octulosonic acid kinase [Marinobacter salicampi]|uniref:3-deoxy-D-manno-octulosonic acid kinase n=1 Tax=Marinobacter salicampi TaxID=435907 RepID=UPI001409D841|nr:3-deoxy-D-manno-octulosonic acid kinase [Marinobacter salicampi]